MHLFAGHVGVVLFLKTGRSLQLDDPCRRELSMSIVVGFVPFFNPVDFQLLGVSGLSSLDRGRTYRSNDVGTVGVH